MKFKFFLLKLTILANGVAHVTAGQGLKFEAPQLLDPRCRKLTHVDQFQKNMDKMSIDTNVYYTKGNIICDADKKKIRLPQLDKEDNWSMYIELINNATEREYATCGQFPQYYKNAYVALDNRMVRRNCSVIPEFCRECSQKCPHVNPDAYGSHKEMVAWSVDTIDLKSEGRCQRDWTSKNIERVWKTNQSWFMNVRQICEGCHEGECSSTVAQHLHNELMAQLKAKAPGREARALKKICLLPVLVGAFTTEALHLESRYNNFDMWLSLRLAAQQCSDVAVLLMIIWSIACTVFFNTDTKARALFDPYNESARRELADQLLNWLKRNLAMKKERKRTRRGKKGQYKKGNVKISKRRLPADTPVLQLRNGKIAGPRRGPAGRGGRRRGLNW